MSDAAFCSMVTLLAITAILQHWRLIKITHGAYTK